jgi:type IV fimbrial biogenesis protein FimT
LHNQNRALGNVLIRAAITAKAQKNAPKNCKQNTVKQWLLRQKQIFDTGKYTVTQQRTSAEQAQQHRLLGFTLVELMVSIAIASILLLMAVPSYQDFITRNSVDAVQNRFNTAVITARTQAAARNTTASLCASNDATSCTGASHWSNGWIVFLDADADATVDNGEDIILKHSSTSNYSLRLQDNAATPANLASLTFTNQGFTLNDQRAFLTICEPKKILRYARGVMVERTGRAMKSIDASSPADGIHDRTFESGTATNLSCP